MNGREYDRIHANEGDTLDVIFKNDTHYICDSKYFPSNQIVVFNSQVADVIEEVSAVDPFDLEKYYHTYEEFDKTQLDDPLCRALYDEDDD